MLTFPPFFFSANPRLLRHTAHNRQPDTKIREYIIRLSQDRGTTFGSTIENFIQCTLDSHETNPFIVTRNVSYANLGDNCFQIVIWEGLTSVLWLENA